MSDLFTSLSGVMFVFALVAFFVAIIQTIRKKQSKKQWWLICIIAIVLCVLFGILSGIFDGDPAFFLFRLFATLGGIMLVFAPVALLISIVQTVRKKHSKKYWWIVFAITVVLFTMFESLAVDFDCEHEYYVIEETAATYESRGKIVYHCDKCDRNRTEYAKKLVCSEHQYEILESISPTYEEKGKNVFQCIVCGKTKTETVKKLVCTEHDFTLIESVDPTYKKKGKNTYRCNKCGENKTEYVDKLVPPDSEISTTETNREESDPSITTDVYGNNIPEGYDTSMIEVTFETDHIDGDALLLKVYVKNTSDRVFKGDIYVYFTNARGKRLGSDTILVDELMPGRESWANVWIDVYTGVIEMSTYFSDVSFEELDDITAKIDNEATERTKSSFKLNFDTTSWYSDVKTITVYKNGQCIVVSTSTDNNAVIASAIWSCGREYGVKTVRVVDMSGKIQTIYPAN